MVNRKKAKLAVLAAAAMFLVAGCSTVTIRDQGTAKLASNPTYQSRESFFLWGLVGESHINVSEYCQKSPPRQLQAQRTFMDGFLTAITLGIYSPRSVMIWCGKESSI